MILKWKKLGRIFTAEGYSDWMSSHTQNPVAVPLSDRCRIFFNTRPAPINGFYQSYPAYVDVELDDPLKVIDVAEQPVLLPGEVGCFDHHGCMCGSVVRYDDVLWMYYVGWSRGVDVPYRWAIGLAISDDEGRSFRRYSQGPLLTADTVEPLYLHNAPHVVRLSGDDWRMWYSAGTKWLVNGEKKESVYVIKEACSVDGINWQRSGKSVVPAIVKRECQTSATLFSPDGRYHMLFSYRHATDFRNAARGYRLGYAISDDSGQWQRADEKNLLTGTTQDWDCEMTCYPYVARLNEKPVLFYCGNGFGRGGLGCAVLER